MTMKNIFSEKEYATLMKPRSLTKLVDFHLVNFSKNKSEWMKSL